MNIFKKLFGKKDEVQSRQTKHWDRTPSKGTQTRFFTIISMQEQWMRKPITLIALLLAGVNSFGNEPAGWLASPELVKKSSARRKGAMFDESKIPPYALPDLLKTLDGTKVSSPEIWTIKRRPEILELFKKEMYGRAPVERPEGLSFKVFDEDAKVLGGRATRKQIRINFTGKKDGPGLDLLVYLPNNVKLPVPTFLTVEFHGNHKLHKDPAIRINHADERTRGKASPKKPGRGIRANRYPIEKILERGYGFAAFCYGDVAPDRREGFKGGVYPAFDKPGKRPADAWAAITAWAWGASRAMDYFETDNDIDHKRIAVEGLSRLGKTALWTGARDERFALAISTCSGCGGAALSRRRYGESISRLNSRFSYWTCDNFKKYSNKEDELPFDQHMFVALMAPRPVYVSSADTDLWADPRGEFLSCKHATPAYQLLGKKGLESDSMPSLNKPINKGRIGYHIRTGGHSVNEYDWRCYMDFADRFLK